MGAADVVPGVSGGTIAFITGIYEELISSIKSIDQETIRLLFQGQLAAFWKQINGAFLLTVLVGILTSLVSLAQLMTYLLQHYPIEIWSFFFGLIAISSPLITREIKKWNGATIFSGLLGLVIAYVITILSPAATPDSWWFIVICGAVAICAMILPGISGAFILLLLGKYEYMVRALTGLDVVTILVFVVGCVAGLLSFSRFLSWILMHYRFPTLALLAGFMVGSLNKVWPWKEVTSFRLNQQGEQVPAFDMSIWPWNYLERTGQDPKIFQAILFVSIGVFLVVVVEKLALLLKSKH